MVLSEALTLWWTRSMREPKVITHSHIIVCVCVFSSTQWLWVIRFCFVLWILWDYSLQYPPYSFLYISPSLRCTEAEQEMGQCPLVAVLALGCCRMPVYRATLHTKKKKKVCLTLSINIGNNGVKKTYKELTMLPVFLMVFPRWSRGERQPHHHLPRVPYICRAAGGGVPERADVPDQRSQVCIDFLNELHLTVFVCNIRYHINVPRVPEHSIQSIDANTPATRCSLFRNQVCENKIACIIGERWPVW